jgi:hypothetical protein
VSQGYDAGKLTASPSSSRVLSSTALPNSTYISQDPRLRKEYFDPDLVVDEDIKKRLMEGVLDRLQEVSSVSQGYDAGKLTASPSSSRVLSSTALGRRLYDQLSPLGPILLALTAATPIYKGFLVDTECRRDRPWRHRCGRRHPRANYKGHS